MHLKNNGTKTTTDPCKSYLLSALLSPRSIATSIHNKQIHNLLLPEEFFLGQTWKRRVLEGFLMQNKLLTNTHILQIPLCKGQILMILSKTS